MLLGTGALATIAQAQSDPAPATLDPVVVTDHAGAERSFDVPASIDVIDGATIREGQPAINLSEPLVRVPGVFRGQSQQLRAGPADQLARLRRARDIRRARRRAVPGLHSRDHARRQGQTGSFSLLSAKSIEVLRGPFSTLYGNASGGVISVFTEDLRRFRSSKAR
jgi:iron complex outermembrane receptor protein